MTVVSNPEDPMWFGRDAEVPHLRLDLERVFGVDRTPKAAILGDPFELHVAVDTASNVYVLDGQAKRLVSFSPEGRIRWQVGRQGEGPGEFDNPAEIAISPAGRIVVTNHGRTRLDTWDLDGTFISSRAVGDAGLAGGAGFTFLAGFLDSSRLVSYSGIRGGSGSRIVVFDPDQLPQTDQFGWDQSPTIEMPTAVSSPASVLAHNGLVFVGSGTAYQFRVYSADGSIVRHVTRNVDYPTRSGFVEYEGGASISSFGEVLAPMVLDPSYLLVCVTWVRGIEDPDETAARRAQEFRAGRRPPPLDWRSSFDLYDREGRLLYSIEEGGSDWPSTGHPQFIGPDNRLYTIADEPFPQIRRYRVIVSPDAAQ